jgi:hypothetical protein
VKQHLCLRRFLFGSSVGMADAAMRSDFDFGAFPCAKVFSLEGVML